MIVDPSALFAILNNEDDFETFVVALASSQGSLAMSSASKVEAYIVAQRSGRPDLEALLSELLADYGIEILPLSLRHAELAIEAHRIFGRSSGHPAKLNYGDCFSYALAADRAEPLLFKGRDFAFTDLVSALG